jgi:hypothetical protein
LASSFRPSPVARKLLQSKHRRLQRTLGLTLCCFDTSNRLSRPGVSMSRAAISATGGKLADAGKVGETTFDDT